MTTLVIALLGSWLLTATVLGLFLGRMMSDHDANRGDVTGGANRSTRAA
jgi:hypothetical protein